MRRREREGKAPDRLRGQPVRGLARDMGGMVVENDLDRGVGGVGGVEELKKLVAVLIQTDRFGTSIAQSLRGHSDYMRVMARQRAEERAAKLAVKLVFPIFFCVMPSLFVVTVGPVLTRLIRDLLPMIDNM